MTGADILCDAHMVAMGITAGRLPADNEVRCFLRDERVLDLAQQWGTTRSAAAVSLWEPHLDGAVVAIGNAPTALFHLMEMLIAGAPRPAAIIGCPVGFIGAAESKDALVDLRVDHGIDIPFVTVRGRRGGSAMASSAVNALAQEAGMTGHFYGVGLGPGDPELITLKAARLIREADVVAYHAGVKKQSHARRIAADLIPDGVIEEELRYPVTTGTTDHPGGYAGAMAEFYESSAARLAAHLEAGRTVVLLAEGDPLFYGSYMYMHDRLSERFPTEVVPGVTAFAAATAAVSSPLVRQTDVLTVLPGTLPEPELARRLADTDGAIIMKLGRTFPAVRSALEQAGRLEHALYVERASMPGQRWLPVADVDPETVPYFSLIVVPGDSLHEEPGGRRAVARSSRSPRRRSPSCSSSASGPGPTSGSPPRSRRRWRRSTTSSATGPT